MLQWSIPILDMVAELTSGDIQPGSGPRQSHQQKKTTQPSGRGGQDARAVDPADRAHHGRRRRYGRAAVRGPLDFQAEQGACAFVPASPLPAPLPGRCRECWGALPSCGRTRSVVDTVQPDILGEPIRLAVDPRFWHALLWGCAWVSLQLRPELPPPAADGRHRKGRARSGQGIAARWQQQPAISSRERGAGCSAPRAIPLRGHATDRCSHRLLSVQATDGPVHFRAYQGMDKWDYYMQNRDANLIRDSLGGKAAKAGWWDSVKKPSL